jgi:CheY-like chemotaxis protein
VSESVESAATAIQALTQAAAANRPYELVLLDHHLPEMDGLNLARTINAEPAFGRPAMVMLSSDPEKLTLAQLTARGLAAADQKPVSASRLRALILRVLGTPPANRTSVEAQKNSPFEPPSSPHQNQAEAKGGGSNNGSPALVLIVEDNVVNQKVAAKLLKNFGYAADLVNNGQEAIAALDEHPYSLVLMDVQMPIMDGLEATQVIRKAQASKKAGFDREIYIVAMTANAMQGDRELCLSVGMNDYITKPFRPDAIEDMLTKFRIQFSGTLTQV